MWQMLVLLLVLGLQPMLVLQMLDVAMQNGYLMSERNPTQDPTRNLDDYFGPGAKPESKPGSKAAAKVSANSDFAAALSA